ncbi:MAG: hypothetical protein WCS55_04645 [Sulfuricurvum sp.]|uniref:hypothetical protein n=1 Tax=Sulfuricurvum sp. TaxID=2025608 RepID=UPI00356B3858
MPQAEKEVSKKQKAWGYMRRNRTFLVKDIIVIIPMSIESIRGLLYRLEAKGFIRKENHERSIKKRIYTLIVDKGVECPV